MPQRQDHQKVAYVTNPRQIAVFRRSESRFADAIGVFLESLGLGVSVVIEPELASIASASDASAEVASRCGAAIFALESSVIQDDLHSRAGGRTAQPSLSTTMLFAYAAQHFTGKRLIVVKQQDDPVQWRPMAAFVQGLRNDASSAKQLVQALCAADVAIPADLLKPPAQLFEFPAEWWEREFEDGSNDSVPSFTEFLVDSMFNRSLTQTKMHDEVREKIQSREALDLKYHYVGWRAARAWEELTEDTNYAHSAHIKRLVKRVPDIIQYLDTSTPYNYISLGPGIGDTDADVLKALRNALNIRSLYLVDVSIELLQIAADRIIKNVLERHVLKPAPRVRAMLADFENSLKKLAPIINVPGVRNLYTLLGFTIGNGGEASILQSIAAGARSGDFVLFDARLHDNGVLSPDYEMNEAQREALIAPYATETLEAFAFAPVEEACDYIVRAEDIEIDLVPSWGKEGHQFFSEVPSAINVYVECTGLYENREFMDRMGISGRTARAGEKLRLATLTFYDFESLAGWIERSRRFNVIWRRELDGAGLMLLEVRT